jgi:nucleotide-binding universal stress UspA family protein
MSAKSFLPVHIVLAVDGSDHARAAARLICDLPLLPDSEITALAVLTDRHLPGRATLLAALDEARRLLPHRGLHVRTELVPGHPAEVLTRFARQHRPGLLVVGARGQRSTLSILLGGVTQQVVEHAECPVLVVRAPYTGMRRVLLAVDGSPSSQRALQYLAHFPLPSGAEVHVLHVLPPPLEPSALIYVGRPDWMLPPFPTHELERMAAQQAEVEERAAQQLLSQALEMLKAADIDARSFTRQGDASTEILQHLQAHVVDLIVMGSRGLSAVSGWWLGSVSRKLIHYSGKSVLIVRGDNLTTRSGNS